MTLLQGKPLTQMTGKTISTFERIALVVLNVALLYSAYQRSVNGRIVEYL